MYLVLAVIFAAAIIILKFMSVIFGILYMHYEAAHKNKKLSAVWYICGLFFSFPTLIAFLATKKSFPGEDVKVCPQCGDRFFQRFEICPKCLIELPSVDSEEKFKQKKLSKIFGITVLVLYSLIVILGCIFNSSIFDGILEDELGYRIAVDNVYYDMHGNAYEDEFDVLLYDEEGNAYFYAAVPSEIDPLSEDYYYMNESGDKFYELDCYVTAEGWFYYDEEGLLYTIDTDNMTEEEADEFFELYLGSVLTDEYRYYNFPYTDGDGNIYYPAYEASWNEYGELITAKNDVSIF